MGAVRRDIPNLPVASHHRGATRRLTVAAICALFAAGCALNRGQVKALRDSAAVEQFYASEKPEYVFLAAAKVGGIYANDHQPAEFLLDNLQIQNNVIHGAHRNLRLKPFHGFGAAVEWFLHFFISADLPPFQKHAPRV